MRTTAIQTSLAAVHHIFAQYWVRLNHGIPHTGDVYTLAESYFDSGLLAASYKPCILRVSCKRFLQVLVSAMPSYTVQAYGALFYVHLAWCEGSNLTYKVQFQAF